MSTTGIDALDKSLQTTQGWLDQIMTVVGPDRQLAWHALGAVLRAMRDRLPLDLAVDLGTMLPLVVRGIYYDQWNMRGQRNSSAGRDEFLASVAEELALVRPINAERAARIVLQAVERHIDPADTRRMREALPEDIRSLWVVIGNNASRSAA